MAPSADELAIRNWGARRTSPLTLVSIFAAPVWRAVAASMGVTDVSCGDEQVKCVSLALGGRSAALSRKLRLFVWFDAREPSDKHSDRVSRLVVTRGYGVLFFSLS